MDFDSVFILRFQFNSVVSRDVKFLCSCNLDFVYTRPKNKAGSPCMQHQGIIDWCALTIRSPALPQSLTSECCCEVSGDLSYIVESVEHCTVFY